MIMISWFIVWARSQIVESGLLCYLGGDNVQKAIDAMFATRNRAGIGAYTGYGQKVVRKRYWTNAAGIVFRVEALA